jgi:hypothetical protein
VPFAAAFVPLNASQKNKKKKKRIRLAAYIFRRANLSLLFLVPSTSEARIRNLNSSGVVIQQDESTYFILFGA